MLRELRIREFAIIDDITIGFFPGLNVMTGETGAGKSIVMQALALLCGGRATVDVIRGDAEESTLEGLFELPGAAGLLETLGLPAAEEVLVRRVIPRTGKGRVHINGNLATVGLLTQLGNSLVHIYGQHDQSLLLQPGSHLELLDRFAELDPLRHRMAAAFGGLTAAQAHLDELRTGRVAREQRRDLLDFQIQELTAAQVLPDEESQLRREREILRHAERLQQACRDAEAALYSGDGAMTGTLTRLAGHLQDLLKLDEDLREAATLIADAGVQLEEAAAQLRAHANRIHPDPERLDAAEDRLALLSRLARKYHVESTALPAMLEELEREHGRLESDDAECAAAERARAEQHGAALAVARDLAAARHKAASQLETRMAGELSALGMEGARFLVEQTTAADDGADAIRPTGIDRVEFLLCANPGESPKPLARVASGGELSRIMLALKALTAMVIETPILIFDEVDAGIGGTVADAVARRLKALAQTRQLLCITHLPQIAAYADHQFAVEKHHAHTHGRTVATVRPLSADERVAELSRMLGGSVAPSEAERYARRMITQARNAARA